MAWVMNLSIASSVMDDRNRKIFTLHRTGSIALLSAVIWLNGGCVSSGSNQNPDRLIGTEWLALEIDGAPVQNNTESTLKFEEMSRVTGNGGCNRFFGTAMLSGETLEVGPLGTTRMACPETVMNQEYRFLKALELARRYRVDDAMDLLYLSNEQGQPILRFSQNKPGVSH
jgi:heat shock protein HslJ